MVWLEELVDRLDPPPPHLVESIHLLITVCQALT
ncbi:hypothetical protein DFJ66_6548 [Saccharothrix variisporea]|uniref:Uncharacterized protein n=1 Tax=Saccharothrix variisporea TaxID=543527 RepID=A0A495XHK7_9PSEU|nr:hypothetical protein DFJ66_6548 [Saccharothrix variisporea]